MLKSLWILFAASFFAVAQNEKIEEKDWKELVGESLEEHWSTDGRWVLLEGGVIHLSEAKSKTWKNYQKYLVLKNGEASDFEMEFEYKSQQNSGIYFHIPDTTKVDGGKHKEVQIFKRWPAEKKLNDHAAGGVIPGHPPTEDACNPQGEWNLMQIRCVGNQMTVRLNGKVVNAVNLNKGRAGKRSKKGGFAFQDHGFALWLRKVRLKVLD